MAITLIDGRRELTHAGLAAGDCRRGGHGQRAAGGPSCGQTPRRRRGSSAGKHAFASCGFCGEHRRAGRDASALVASGVRPVFVKSIGGLLRFYDPTTGQFISRDPLNPMTRSAYGYAGGSPLNRRDPSGLDPVQIQYQSGTDANGDPTFTDAGIAPVDAVHAPAGAVATGVLVPPDPGSPDAQVAGSYNIIIMYTDTATGIQVDANGNPVDSMDATAGLELIPIDDATGWNINNLLLESQGQDPLPMPGEPGGPPISEENSPEKWREIQQEEEGGGEGEGEDASARLSRSGCSGRWV